VASTVCQEILLNVVEGWCRSASRFVPFTAFGGWPFSASWAASPGAHRTQAVTNQTPQIIQGLTAGPHQQGDEGMLQPGHALGEVGLPGQFPVGGFALNIRLLQGLHQQGQVLEQLAGVEPLS